MDLRNNTDDNSSIRRSDLASRKPLSVSAAHWDTQGPESRSHFEGSFNHDQVFAKSQQNAPDGQSLPHKTQRFEICGGQSTPETRQAFLDWQQSTQAALPQRPSPFPHLVHAIRSQLGDGPVILSWGRCDFSHLPVEMLLSAFSKENALLETQTHEQAAQYTVLGITLPETRYIDYRWRDNALLHGVVGQLPASRCGASVSATCELMQQVLHVHRPQNKELASWLGRAVGRRELVVGGVFDGDLDRGQQLPPSSPFWGGWMSYAVRAGGDQRTARFSFAFVHRSIVIDHAAKTAYVQSLLPSDWAWIINAGAILDGIVSRSEG